MLSLFNNKIVAGVIDESLQTPFLYPLSRSGRTHQSRRYKDYVRYDFVTTPGFPSL